MTAYVHDTQFFTRRTAVLVAIVALHLFILWALATGLARKAIEVLAPPIQTDIVEEEKTKSEPPPPPPPEMQKQVVEVPPPDINIAMPEAGPATNAISAVVAQPHAPAPPPHPAAPGVPVKFKPLDTDGFYPDASRRLSEEGTATIHVCVGANGKISEAPTITATSGHDRLDQGAISYAKALRYSPQMDEGKPVDGCINFRVKFSLR
jgi:protein TonB